GGLAGPLLVLQAPVLPAEDAGEAPVPGEDREGVEVGEHHAFAAGGAVLAEQRAGEVDLQPGGDAVGHAETARGRLHPELGRHQLGDDPALDRYVLEVDVSDPLGDELALDLLDASVALGILVELIERGHRYHRLLRHSSSSFRDLAPEDTAYGGKYYSTKG